MQRDRVRRPRESFASRIAGGLGHTAPWMSLRRSRRWEPAAWANTPESAGPRTQIAAVERRKAQRPSHGAPTRFAKRVDRFGASRRSAPSLQGREKQGTLRAPASAADGELWLQAIWQVNRKMRARLRWIAGGRPLA